MAQATRAPRGRGRPRAGEEIDTALLLLAALDAFAETGYDGMSVRELGRRLGVSHALLTALPLFQLQPNGFANKDLRPLIAEVRAAPPDTHL